MAAIICPITLTPKSGVTVSTLWRVYQHTPSIDLYRGDWRFDGSISESARRQALDQEYRAELLRLDLADLPAENVRDALTGDRRDHAGYADSSMANPGLAYRGRELGELRAEIRQPPGWDSPYCRFEEGNGTPANSARNWLRQQAAPVLLAFTDENRELLKTEAIARAECDMRSALTQAFARLGQAASEVPGILEALAGEEG